MPSIKASTSSTFSLPSLPPELRIQIWNDALPLNDKGAIFFYRKDCWAPRWLEESDAGYLAGCDNIVFSFDLNLLEKVTVKEHLPLASVNREARGSALAWAYKQGIEYPVNENVQQHAMVRSFDPTRDILFVRTWHEFFIDASDRMFEPDLHERTISSHPVYARIAIPEAQLFADWEAIGDLFVEQWFWPDVLYIIINTPMYAQMEIESVGAQRRWEIVSQGRPFIWNRQHLCFDLAEGESGEYENLYRRIGEVLEKLPEKLARERFHRLEIRPAIVGRC